MRAKPFRLPALIAIVALVLGACGPSGSATNPPGSAPGSNPPASSASAAPTVTIVGGTAQPGQVEIRWYCCLGGGDAPEQVAVEKKVVEAFNASHPNIHLTFEAVPYAGANDALATQIGSGNGPDIVGPVGIGGANAFHGQWLDLAPLIQKTNYDLSGFPPDAVDIYKLDEGQVGIPFAIYPSALFYKKGLFEEAGLKEPPHKYGDKYELDGQMVDWNYDTAREIAKVLTVDKAGKDATQDGFDKDNIVQWGFEPQRDDLRGLGAYWGAGQLAASDGKTAQIPDDWKTAWKWWYDGMWKDHFSMTGPIYESDDINPQDYPFFTGKVAMSENFLWSTYGVADAGDDWDLAAIPANGSKTTAAFNADTFRILKDTKHPDEAFEVLTYLLGDASEELLTAYGGFPARIADQEKGIEALQAQFENTVDWQAAIDGIEHADNPNFEAYMPAYNETLGLVGSGGKYTTKWQSTEGLDMDAEFNALQQEIQGIWDKAGGG
jgi:multiple sugar transport system substrate-binding protein